MLLAAVIIAILASVVIAYLRSRGIVRPVEPSPELTREQAAELHKSPAQLADPDDPYGGYPPPNLPFSKRLKDRPSKSRDSTDGR
jgi:hypothetical protein